MFLLNFIFNILNLIKAILKSSVQLQYDALFRSLDLVERTPKSCRKTIKLGSLLINPQFALIAVNFVAINLYGVFVLQYDHTGRAFNLSEISNSSYVFYKQIYPKSIWPQSSSLYGISAAICWLVYLQFTFKPMIDNKLKILIDQEDGRMTVNERSLLLKICFCYAESLFF